MRTKSRDLERPRKGICLLYSLRLSSVANVQAYQCASKDEKRTEEQGRTISKKKGLRGKEHPTAAMSEGNGPRMGERY